MPALLWPRTEPYGLGPSDASMAAARRTEFGSGILTAFTIARLALVPVIIMSFLTAPAVTTTALVLFVVADVYDGVLARRSNRDGVRRRAIDSTVDRVAIDACLVAAYFAGALPLLLLVAFLARDVYCAGVCARMVTTRHVAIRADWLYRGLNLSIAGWAIAAPFIPIARIELSAVLLGVSIVVAADLTRSVRIILATPYDIGGSVIGAAVARRMLSSQYVSE